MNGYVALLAKSHEIVWVIVLAVPVNVVNVQRVAFDVGPAQPAAVAVSFADFRLEFFELWASRIIISATTLH